MRALALVVVALVALACGGGQPLTVGLGEPLRVRGAQFISGTMPGAAPIDAGTPDMDAGPAPKPQGIAVTDVEATNAIALPGQANKKFSGRATIDAVAVGIRLADVGSGYWVLPTSSPDPQFPGEITWEAQIDFAATLAGGNHMLRVVAVDANGNASAQAEFRICVAPRVPDNLHACSPNVKPPEAVFALTWDADVDLDLEVTTPDGTLVSPKGQATTTFVDAGRPGDDVGVIDRDSLASCIPDGLRQENLVFQKRPSGTFTIAVNLFDACKKPGARYALVVYEATGDGPDRHLEETFRRSGHVADIDANGGSHPGLFVVDYPF